MSIKKVSIALASVLVVAAGVPAFAGTVNTSGTSQSNVQTNTIDGSRNRATNTSNQSATTRQSGRRTDSEAATVQTSDQLNELNGRRNVGKNDSTQRSNTRQSR